jgi:peptide/nickel transport system substrate-binding protein
MKHAFGFLSVARIGRQPFTRNRPGTARGQAVALLLLFVLCVSALAAQHGGELRFALHADPKTFHPLMVEQQPAETIRFLTGGVLFRVNRRTQQAEPQLATSWNGTPFTAQDVAFTIEKLMDLDLHSATADSFRSSAGKVEIEVTGPHQVSIRFPAPVAGVERLFDQVPILSARSPKAEQAVLGPFFMAEHKAGSYVLLKRNPHYWKRDEKGRRLPYLDAIRLEIQRNRQTEMLRFRRGRFHLINSLDPEHFERLAGSAAASAYDAGPSLNSEFLWFNQVPDAPIDPWKRPWFRSQQFRRAVSEAIHRADLARLVYRGYAQPAAGPVSPANHFWFNEELGPHAYDPDSALARLEKEGFRRQGEMLVDREGRPVEFSIITNSGNKSRERMAAMIQQDLAKLGIRLNVVTLDFPSLIERMTRTFDYEACLLGVINVDLDPNDQMNVWLSSARNHQWNPSQKSPATPWEAEIDELMQAQASDVDPQKRKVAFDRVQRIIWEQAPFIYLVHRNALSAISPRLRNTAPGVLWPQTFWNAEKLYFETGVAESHE